MRQFPDRAKFKELLLAFQRTSLNLNAVQPVKVLNFVNDLNGLDVELYRAGETVFLLLLHLLLQELGLARTLLE